MNTQPDNPLVRTRWSLEGLSVGDAFGESLFLQGFARHSLHSLETMLAQRILPRAHWTYTDDTQMALSIVEILRQFGEIEQDHLARSFAHRFERTRGYGPAMYKLLPRLQAGEPWKSAARSLFGGQGSFGNGGAMRVAPVGAYFADNLEAVIENARRSTEITHAHPEAVAGAIAVAVATAWAWRLRNNNPLPKGRDFLDLVLPSIPESKVRQGVALARTLLIDKSVWEIVAVLGNGSGISAQDTVPFVLWCAAQHLDNYEEALWLTASGQGDIDTNCAMVGGIVAAYVGIEGIPVEWLRYRESLPLWVFAES
ncbi:MAG: crystallin J1 [Anaerolineae bacterium]|nr:ADP-ribosylglycohydrolase family protein [Anaerolineales bacterium]MCQ3974261.1 crystallin J1 [Anaerolineae bacterium]